MHWMCRMPPLVIEHKTVTLAILLVFCLLFGGCGAATEALPQPTDRFFVNDYADVLTQADEDTVYKAGRQLMEQTDAQLVLVTVNTLGDRELEGYALELAREWELGDAEKENGLLVLFVTEGPRTRVEVGFGLEGALNDSKVGRILDEHLVPVYDDPAAWSAALAATYRAYVHEVYAEYGLAESAYPVDTEDNSAEEGGGWIEIAAVFVALLTLGLLRYRGGLLPVGVFLGGFGGHGRGGYRGGGGFRGGGGGFGGGGASR